MPVSATSQKMVLHGSLATSMICLTLSLVESLLGGNRLGPWTKNVGILGNLVFDGPVVANDEHTIAKIIQARPVAR
jgi:hypothetical protein